MGVSRKYLVKGLIVNSTLCGIEISLYFTFYKGGTIVSVDPLNEMSKLAPFIVRLMTHQRGLIVKQTCIPL